MNVRLVLLFEHQIHIHGRGRLCRTSGGRLRRTTRGGYAASFSRWCGSAQSSTGPAGTIRRGLRWGWVV
jgi:hypothetical protein